MEEEEGEDGERPEERERKREGEETEWMKLDSKLYKASRGTDALGFTERSPLLKKNKAPACCLSRLHISPTYVRSLEKKNGLFFAQ